MRKRPSARLLVLDPEGRVLLFNFDHRNGPLAGTSLWATPGGALESGENYAEAAKRELMEETGLDCDVGPEVARRRVSFLTPQGETVDADERYFLVRCDGTIDHHANPDLLEREFVRQARFWSLDEIAASSETIFPENIAEMIAAAPDPQGS